jgi:hypothetical protein
LICRKNDVINVFYAYVPATNDVALGAMGLSRICSYIAGKATYRYSADVLVPRHAAVKYIGA